MGSDDSVLLLEAVGKYIETIASTDDYERQHKELYRFVHWCGPERVFDDISAPEIGDYAEQLGGTGTTPLAAERLQVVRSFLSYARKKGLIDKNLAQHVRVRKSKSRSKESQARDSQNVIELTPEGHAQLLKEAEKLKGERAPLAVQIRTAAADKDVRENAPLEAVREQLGMVESRIATIEETLKDAVVIDPATRGTGRTVKLGARVSMKDMDTGRETSYMLVSPSEANPQEGKISNVSPLGKAFIGRRVGQVVEVETPRGKARYRVVGVSA